MRLWCCLLTLFPFEGIQGIFLNHSQIYLNQTFFLLFTKINILNTKSLRMDLILFLVLLLMIRHVQGE